MSRLNLWLPIVVFATLGYIALYCGSASARPISNAVALSPVLESGNTIAEAIKASGVHLNLIWRSRFSQWHFFDSKYNHEVTLLVGSYYGKMEYVSRDFKSHCHEDGVWCVTHGDPQSLEIVIWYKGYNYQHNTVTADCNSKMPVFCRQYDDYIDPSVA
ncbi:hypothetical protein BKA57DRAFT_516497 [Linnemannia elongata]|nr:hypothetical protein BKA57DRAFT_516497 [Linnemannia elongata]